MRFNLSTFNFRYYQLEAKMTDNTDCQEEEEDALSRGWSWATLLTGLFWENPVWPASLCAHWDGFWLVSCFGPGTASGNVNGCLSFPFFFLVVSFLTQDCQVMGNSHLQHLISKASSLYMSIQLLHRAIKTTHILSCLSLVSRKFYCVSSLASAQSWWL